MQPAAHEHEQCQEQRQSGRAATAGTAVRARRVGNQRVRAEYVDFLTVRFTVAVGVRILRVGSAIALVAIIETVIVGILVARISAVFVLVTIADAVVVAVVVSWVRTILAFVVYHMLHFTVRTGKAAGYDTLERYKTTLHGVEGEVHNAWLMVIDGFSVWYVSLFYVVAMTFLASHLLHGFQSVFQTLGLRSQKSAPALKQISIAYTLFIWLGFISIPVAINFFGFGR